MPGTLPGFLCPVADLGASSPCSHPSSGGPAGGGVQLGLTLPPSPPLQVSELIFVSIYSSEFCMKLYVDPINYWKDGYNLLDVVIIIIIFIPYSLRKIKGKHYPYLNIADGVQSLRILKLITYSRGIRVSGLERGGSASAGDRAPDEVVLLLLSCGD